jgi:AraC-like DNA-binding protein
MLSTDDRRRMLFWRPDSSSVTRMLRVEHEDRLRTTYSEHFLVAVVYEGAFDGWYRGGLRAHVAGAIKLKEPGEVHRDVRVHAPFTLQGAGFSQEMVAAAAAALGLRGSVHFKAPGFGARDRATRLAFAMHAALVRPDVPEIERATRVAETLGEILADSRSGATSVGDRAPRAVRRARAFLHDALADKITLDDLAIHAGLDKFHLVRAFRADVGLPPYEYLTHVRVWKAKELLQRGVLVAEAAQAVGFYDESQLHRHFRRIVGITPGRYARSFAAPARTSQHRPSGARAIAAHSPHERTYAQ